VSITPTTTDRDPVVVSQASATSISASVTPPVCPVLWRPQSREYDGSFEVAAVVITKSGSTYRTPGVAAAQPCFTPSDATSARTIQESARAATARPSLSMSRTP
jgi:hypothetical protein